MSFFNDAQIHGMLTGEYVCPECGAAMKWEDDHEEVLICPECGYESELDRYGFGDDSEYEALYPTKADIYGVDDEADEDCGETYDEVYGELNDDD